MGGPQQLSDVAIIGLGPVGALLANLLGQAGLEVEVFERDREIYDYYQAPLWY